MWQFEADGHPFPRRPPPPHLKWRRIGQDPVPPSPRPSLCNPLRIDCGNKSHSFSLSTLSNDAGRTVELTVVGIFAASIKQSAGRVVPGFAPVALYPVFIVPAGESKLAKATHAARLSGLFQRVILRIKVAEIAYSLYAWTMDTFERLHRNYTFKRVPVHYTFFLSSKSSPYFERLSSISLHSLPAPNKTGMFWGVSLAVDSEYLAIDSTVLDNASLSARRSLVVGGVPKETGDKTSAVVYVVVNVHSRCALP